MDEFLKINWRIKDNKSLELLVAKEFLSEEIISNSLIFESFQNNNLFNVDEKTVLPKESTELNYSGKNLQPTTIKSSLDIFAHAQCLKALKLINSGKNASNYTNTENFVIGLYQKLKQQILEENVRYQSFAQNKWIETCNKAKPFNGPLQVKGKDIWERKWEKLKKYPQFYKDINIINMFIHEEDVQIDFKWMRTLLDLGNVANFDCPLLIAPYYVNETEDRVISEVKCPYSRLQVSEDLNIAKILQTNPYIDIITSFSTIKCISDLTDLKKRWMIPVKVRKINYTDINGAARTKNIVFLDKPFNNYKVSKDDFTYSSFKRLIKSHFCRNEVHSFSKDTELNFPRNVTYKLWQVRKSYNQINLKTNKKSNELNVLIRSKLDACEKSEIGFHPIILKPKLENQPNFGATLPSKKELAQEWAALFFNPFSHLYRMRLSRQNGQILCAEKCSMQKIASEAQNYYQYKPNIGLGTLQSVFERLSQLDEGNFLLQHLPKHEAFIALLKETDANTGNFNFYEEYERTAISEFPAHYLPIDVNFILPDFEAENRMPGMFTPRLKSANFKGGKKKSKFKNHSVN